MYMDVYGTAFSELSIKQYNYLAGEYNLIWVQLVPTTPILATHQIVIEFPTLSSDQSTPMFEDGLGLNIADGEEIPFDVFDSLPLDNAYMNCRLFHGDQSRAVPVRVVCGNILSGLVSPTFLRFALGFMNPPSLTAPSIPAQISLPLLVYSYDPFLFQKTNFNLVNAAVFVYNGNAKLNPNIPVTTASNQLQMPDDQLLLGDAHTDPLQTGDSYVIRLAFPIRVNDILTCSFASGTIPGTAYYHERLRVIVCQVLSGVVPSQSAPLIQTMTVTGFYSPWYRLADSERQVNAIATYSSTSTSEVINYFTLFPLLVPRWEFNTLSTLQITPHLGHNVACQRDDYTFTIILETPGSAETDLQYTDLVSITLPLITVNDYFPLNTDCVEHPSSEIEVVACTFDMDSRTLFVEIVPGLYTNGLKLAVKTVGLALRNPCNYWAVPDIKNFIVYFYSWENLTAANFRSLDYAYMTINSLNMLPFPLAYVLEPYDNAYHFSFDWVKTPHERYYSDFPQYTTNQYSPFSF